MQLKKIKVRAKIKNIRLDETSDEGVGTEKRPWKLEIAGCKLFTV